MPFLTPKYIFADITHITLQFLKKNDIRALVLDVDNTLTEHGSQELRPDIEEWLYQMQAAGIRMMIASNNTKERVAPFAEKLGLDYVSFCCKPSPIFWFSARRKWKLPRKNIALIGDQLFTDALAGHLSGVPVLLVRPMAEDPKFSVRFKRKLEAPFILKYYNKGGKLL